MTDVIATETEYGIVKMANVNELYDGEEREGFAPSPYSFKNTVAKEDKYGTVRISTLTEMREGILYQGSAISPLNLSKFTASEAEVGIVKLAKSDIKQSLEHDVLTKKHYIQLEDKIDVLSRKENGDKIPVGLIGMFPKDNIPLGWLIADGTTYIKSVYTSLFEYLGSEYSVSATEFRVPNYNGYFLRGYDPLGEIDPDGIDRVLGSEQLDAMQHLTGGFATDDEGRQFINGCFYINGWANGPGKTGGGTNVRFDNSRQARVSTENRPINKTVVICIRAFSNVENDTDLNIKALIDSYNKLNKRIDDLENKGKNNFFADPKGFYIDNNTGMIIQWGKSVSATGNMNFNIPFPNQCLAVFGTNTTSQGSKVDATYAYVIDKNTFHMRTKGSGGNISSFPSAWWAIGY